MGIEFLREIATFLSALLLSLPSLLPRFTAAWIFSLLLLTTFFSVAKKLVRDLVIRLDHAVRVWAAKLRYAITNHETLEHDETTERHILSWFFRFWTNFASAPSLSFFSLAVPFWMRHLAAPRSLPTTANFLEQNGVWLLPGLCYAGSMLLSFVLKRIFKRVRPPRKGFAFGHKLKDPSFPSGHSLTSFCFWMSCAATIAKYSGWNATPIALFGLLAISVVALTGLSRVYLGVHFPSDVLGGYFIGLVWCVICFVALTPVLWLK